MTTTLERLDIKTLSNKELDGLYDLIRVGLALYTLTEEEFTFCYGYLDSIIMEKVARLTAAPNIR